MTTKPYHVQIGDRLHTFDSQESVDAYILGVARGDVNPDEGETHHIGVRGDGDAGIVEYTIAKKENDHPIPDGETMFDLWNATRKPESPHPDLVGEAVKTATSEIRAKYPNGQELDMRDNVIACLIKQLDYLSAKQSDSPLMSYIARLEQANYDLSNEKLTHEAEIKRLSDILRIHKRYLASQCGYLRQSKGQ